MAVNFRPVGAPQVAHEIVVAGHTDCGVVLADPRVGNLDRIVVSSADFVCAVLEFEEPSLSGPDEFEFQRGLPSGE